ncbi:dockerin type I domain-containing protein [Ruminococcus sp.]|uniref:dockerin type I domain-containing protein n=1 Tax=Ruminococcus sp. TaxID=41978 RepID=UPI00388D1CB8
MKKLLSVILAAVLLTSGMTIAAASASAAEPEEKPVYLLGDADLDGQVNVVDAALIQRYEVRMAELTDQQLLTADVDGDDEVNIVDATWIQRWELKMKAPEGIGSPLTEVYKTKAFPILRESVDSTETADVRIYADQPHVPYINVADFYNRFYLLGTDLTEGMTAVRNGNEYTLTNLSTSAIFDVAQDTINTANFEDFTMSAFGIRTAQTGGVDTNHPFIKLSESKDPAEPAPLTLHLGEYGIDLRGDETGVYAPIATVSDIFASTEMIYVICAGERIYTKDYTKAHQPTAALDSDPAFFEAIYADHPADLADFTYRELCFNLDTWYGEPGQEWLHNDLETKKIDQILTEKYPDVKAKLQSADCFTFFTGLNYLINGLLFDGGHTMITSAMLRDEQLVTPVIQSMTNLDYAQKYIYTSFYKQRDTKKRVEARDAAYGDDYYIEKGDTAMIHFDAFVVDYTGWKNFYAGTGERPLIFQDAEGTKYDTVGTVLSGLERAKQNPEIKNIIIDMSCNGGGDSAAMLSIEWLMKGKGYVRFVSQQTGRTKIDEGQFDMNFDGVFDEKDVSPYTDYNYGVLTSNYAFSCGNAYPWFMHEHDSMVLGEKTRGGACAIRLTSAAGIEFACSSNNSKIISDSGESVDFGCPIDVDLIAEGENPYANFYNLDILSAKMNEYFGS